MIALAFGLTAACAWAVHDMFVRKLGQKLALLPMMLAVLGTGSVALLAPAWIMGDWAKMGFDGGLYGPLGLAVAAGLAYVVGMCGLYAAFSLAPVRLVSPILGAYPMLSLGIAAFEGKEVTTTELLAVLAIVAGIALVALMGKAERAAERPFTAMAWAVLGSAGFAATFALAQEATRQGSEFPVMLIARLSTFVGVALVLAASLVRARPTPAQNDAFHHAFPTLIAMGILDALALGLVTASARLDSPEYASISSSLFGVLTILLAWQVLREKVMALQWVGIVIVFAGIAMLSSQG